MNYNQITGVNIPPLVQFYPHVAQSISGEIENECRLAKNQPRGHDFDAVVSLYTLISYYERRIRQLASEGSTGGIELNARSERDFLQFVKSGFYVQRSSLVLLGNGNLRSVWKSDVGNQVGIQFRGHQAVTYVIFKRDSPASKVTRVCGKAALGQVWERIDEFCLQGLLTG